MFAGPASLLSKFVKPRRRLRSDLTKSSRGIVTFEVDLHQLISLSWLVFYLCHLVKNFSVNCILLQCYLPYSHLYARETNDRLWLNLEVPWPPRGTTGNGVRREKAALSRSYGATGAVPLRFRFAKHELNGDRDVDLSAGACRPGRDCHAFCRV